MSTLHREELLVLHRIRLALKEAGYHVVRAKKNWLRGEIRLRLVSYSTESHDRVLTREMEELGLV